MFRSIRFVFAALTMVLAFSGAALAQGTGGGGTGGGTGGGAGGGSGGGGTGGGDDPAKQLAVLREENERLKKEVEEGKKKKEPDPKPEDDLRQKAQKEKDESEKTAAQTKDIERALSFNLSIDDFVVKNSSILPSEITSIVKLAHKETYDNAAAKANALKAAIIQSYFTVADNVASLTPAQKTALDDYLKLTKTGKEQKAADVYENIFEPALEMVRKVRKAEELGRSRSGLATSTESNKAYKDKLVDQARKTHLGEKAGK